MVPEESSVLIFRKRLLPWSETFIAAQGRALERYRPVFTGFHLVEAGSEYLGDADRVLLEDQAFSGLKKGLFKLTGRLPSGWLRKMRERRPAVVHAHFGHNAVQAIPLARALGVPLVVTYHGADIAVEPSAKSHAERRLVFGAATLVLGVSEFIVGRLREAGCPANKVRIHHIGVDVDRFRPHAVAGGWAGVDPQFPKALAGEVRQGRTVLFVGRLVEKKGLHHLLAAMKKIGSAGLSARLLVVGDGPLRSSLETEARALNLDARFLGVQSPSDVVALMQASTVLCAPSVVAANGDAEGLPMTITEAQATGLPVVAFPSGGSGEGVADGVSGYVVAPRDEDGLARRIRSILGDPELRDRLSKGARERAEERFNLKTQTGRLEDLYDEARRLHGGAS